jgi:hypothetical protein
MKTVQVRKNVFLFLGALSFLTVLLSGCLKESRNTTNPPKTYLSLLHLAPRSPAVEVYFNNEQASSAIIPGTVASAYSAVEPGIFSINFKKPGSDSVVASLGASLYDSLKHYTLLLYNIDSTHVRAVRIQDDFSVLANQEKAHYRFFQMSPDFGAVDLYFDNTLIESGREYADNTASDYYNTFLPAAPNTYTATVKKTGTDSVIAQGSVFLSAGRAYTLYLKGIRGATGTTGLGISYLEAAD